MVKEYAVIRNNIVENVILIDGDPSWYQVENGELVVIDQISVGIGFTRNQDGTFNSNQPVIEVVPEVVE